MLSRALTVAAFVLRLAGFVDACGSCAHPENDVTLTRYRPRMQPDAQSAISLPRGPLEWGQLNVLHTTDTHGWLEGHLKEQNYGADWGDWVSFVKRMNQTAQDAGVDLLVVDTGDLHDGAGLSDATSINGQISNPIFESIQYDLLTIGNHELYVTDIAYETFNQFSKVYGDRYLTSNVQILNPSTNEFEYIGQQYRYFTTQHGLRIMSFGFLYDFTGNSNVSRVVSANTSINQQWFKDAVNYDKPIDLFMVLGHNPPRPTVSGSTFGIIHNAIRAMRPDVPIQIFGGHTHVRDFVIYDEISTGLESGRYCETLGWFSMSGLPAYGNTSAKGLPHPSQPAKKVTSSTNTTFSLAAPSSTQTSSPGAPHPYTPATNNTTLLYSRRYLDWNRLTFSYHTNASSLNVTPSLDTPEGTATTNTIYTDRQSLNLTTLYGCAPQSWCQSCAPFLSSANIYSLLTTALQQTVVNASRADTPRMILLNTGSVRFDLFKGPFTYDDSFIVSPFTDTFQFIPDVPTQYASQILALLDGGSVFKRSSEAEPEFDSADSAFTTASGVFLNARETCPNPPAIHASDSHTKRSLGRISRRQTGGLGQTTAGYTTTDDFGTDGDDTVHSRIPYYRQPNYFQANASFPADGSVPAAVDLVFLDYFASSVVGFLGTVGAQGVSEESVMQYLPVTFTTNSYLSEYVKGAPDWQRDVPNCPVL